MVDARPAAAATAGASATSVALPPPFLTRSLYLSPSPVILSHTPGRRNQQQQTVWRRKAVPFPIAGADTHSLKPAGAPTLGVAPLLPATATPAVPLSPTSPPPALFFCAARRRRCWTRQRGTNTGVSRVERGNNAEDCSVPKVTRPRVLSSTLPRRGKRERLGLAARAWFRLTFFT